VLVADHRLERCLGAADRVVALEAGAVACDATPDAFLDWAATSAPALVTPGARLFSLAGLRPLPASVKQARGALRASGLLPEGAQPEVAPERRGFLRRRDRSDSALRTRGVRGVWHELSDGPTLLRGIDLRVEPGERVVLMGRNGAGKSTLLRHVKGLLEPTRGRIDRAGEVALLMQNPGDYLIHEHAEDEAGRTAVDRAGLSGREQANPRDLSGGERQRLALEIVLSGDEPPAVVCLDEPTRGMDRARKDTLAARLRELSDGGCAVIVATHDTEFAATFADRVVLMGQGVVIADGPAAEILSGGWHFATEVARVLGGAGGALTPEQGSVLIDRELVSR
jgi:energy-coupling factor transport system ATP-binding protein